MPQARDSSLATTAFFFLDSHPVETVSPPSIITASADTSAIEGEEKGTTGDQNKLDSKLGALGDQFTREMEDTTLDKTTLATISLLEARLLHIEHILYGSTAVPAVRPPTDSARSSLSNLERRFSVLLSGFRVYADILKLYRTHPTFFQSPTPDDPTPSQLDTDALRATVLSFASSFPGTVSALTAVTSDTPVPDPKLSADLVSLLPRMKGVEATQLAQEAEIAELRGRSEAVVRKWYEERVVGYGSFVANVEGRVERMERRVRRVEALRAKEVEGL